MRSFLLSLVLTGALALSAAVTAAPFAGAGLTAAMRLEAAGGAGGSVVLVQKRSYQGRINRAPRPRVRLKFRHFPAAGPSRTIRSGKGVLRSKNGRPVRTRGGLGKRDIGAGQAVISAQAYMPGTVLGVRRKGSVYNVKILDRNRVRIVPVNASTGQVMR